VIIAKADLSKTLSLSSESVLAWTDLKLGTRRIHPIYFQINEINKVAIDIDGNLGVGTDNPNYKLDVSGNINFTGNLYNDGVLFSSGSGLTELAHTSLKKPATVNIDTTVNIQEPTVTSGGLITPVTINNDYKYLAFPYNHYL
jgi:hypothetical protein